MLILTINSGSTSVKLAAFDASSGRIAGPLLRERLEGETIAPHTALRAFLQRLPGDAAVRASAHRIVHGGTRFDRPIRIDDDVERGIEELALLAPLHNPLGLEWIRATRALLPPTVAHTACFDTAFFASLPRRAGEYALPPAIGTEIGVRRYGFHGLAHEAMWRRWCELRPDLKDGGRIVTLQLGGGCSAAALDRGRPIDTSMGFSPLEGLMMATRSGDIDPAALAHMAGRLGISAAEVVRRLNEESGVLGVSGRTSNVGALLADPDPSAQFAVELYCYRGRKCIGAFLAALGGCDGIVFGGGVGEHHPGVRARILGGLEWLGVRVDANANEGAKGGEASIGDSQGRVAIHVIPGDEESLLARAALSLANT